jgi:HK97 family phage portal protein
VSLLLAPAVAALFAPLVRTFDNRIPPYTDRRANSPLQDNTGIGMPTAERQMRAYMQIGIVFAIVSRISEAVAEADWGLYRTGSAPDSDPVTDHPAAQLWENPGIDVETKQVILDQDEFIEAAQQHFELAGETDWYVGRARGFNMPVEMWPIRPDRIEPVPDQNKFIAGWLYRPPSGREVIPWKRDEVIQMKRPNPLDPYRGLGPLAAAMIDVFGEQAASEYNAAFFRNSAEPGGIIRFPERLDDDRYEEFVDRWRQQHRGVQNAHRVAILEGAEWQERKYTMREMQFPELRKLNHEFIRQAFGFPKSMLGDTEDVNKAAAIAGEYVFVRWIVRPRLNRLQATLNSQLLPMFGRFGEGFEFRFKTPVPADKELEIQELDSIAARAKTLVDAGYDPADVAKYVGLPAMAFEKPASTLPPVGGGDEPSEPAPARRGRPSTADDPEARATWQEAVDYMVEHPSASFGAVAGLVGVSERTLRRYRDTFEA